MLGLVDTVVSFYKNKIAKSSFKRHVLPRYVKYCVLPNLKFQPCSQFYISRFKYCSSSILRLMRAVELCGDLQGISKRVDKWSTPKCVYDFILLSNLEEYLPNLYVALRILLMLPFVEKKLLNAGAHKNLLQSLIVSHTIF